MAMTYADLYHMNEKCEKLQKALPHDEFEHDDGQIVIKLPPSYYEDLEDILRDCLVLIYDLCQADVKDVITRDS